MKKEIHLVIVWLYATEHLNHILNDLSASFEIKDVLQVQWSDKYYSQNLTRFYGENLPNGSDKEIHVGRGIFHAIILEDSHPKYDLRNTTKGDANVNVNIFDAKQKYRALTGGGHKIHATNSPEEAIHDIWLLLGKDISAFQDGIKWDGVIKNWNQDLIGSSGWGSIEDLFETLNRVCKYVVLRNFEPLPHAYHLESHGDIDLLVDDLQACAYAANATKVFPESYRVHYHVRINNKLVPFDFRYVGDQYYDIALQEEVLGKRELIKDSFFVPPNYLYFYTLLYHALIHKPALLKDYASRLMVLSAPLNISFDGSMEQGCKVLSSFLYKNGFTITQPVDRSVYFNAKIAKEINTYRSPISSELIKILDKAQDLSLFSSELRQEWDNEEARYHLAPSRANILRPFEELIQDSDVLEVGVESGAITRYLGEHARTVVSIEIDQTRRALASARTRDLNNVEILEGGLDILDPTRKYGVVTLIGSLEYISFFTNTDEAPHRILQRLYDLLLPNGVLIIAIDNQMALERFANHNGSVLPGYMQGIEEGYAIQTKKLYSHDSLKALVERAGFPKQEFLVPFPSYKTPSSIVTEQGLNDPIFDVEPLASLSARRSLSLSNIPSFALEPAWFNIIEGNLTLPLANSFLLVASKQASESQVALPLAFHYSMDRSPQYCKECHFIKDKTSGHIEVQYRYLCDTDSKLNYLPSISNSNDDLVFRRSVKSAYEQGHLLSRDFTRLLTSDFWSISDVAQLLERYITFLDINPARDLNNISLDLPLSGDHFDKIPQNIVITTEGKAGFIDDEWLFNKPVELGYILFRAISSILTSITRFGTNRDGIKYTKESFLKAAFNALNIPISSQKLSEYIHLETLIQAQVTGLPYAQHSNWHNQWILEPQSSVVADLNHKIENLEDEIVSLNTKMASLDNEVAQRGLWATNLQEELTTTQRQITELTQSNSWRLTRPLREARRWVANPKGQAKRYARMALTVAKRVYFALPLSPEMQAMHRRFATKHMGWLLKAIRSGQQTPEIQPLPFPVTEPIDLTLEEELDLARNITLNTSATPLVSVIIPIYGQCNYTLLCLASIAKHAPSIPYEIIVVDDYSPDHSREIIKHVANIKFIENAQNQGFIRSCNAGAKAAAGEYVCFLNNDTQVAPGWLEELHRTFIEFPGTGLAGSKLVYPNGMLQEAGGILWQDGSAWNFGRNQDPRLPIYNYARETDYCSGASIMVPAQLFKELGGFDEHYLPAYCEDSDLALKIRSRGYRVIYQPLSVVVHFEGITSGTDTSQGAKAYQIENSKKLFLRWKEQLASHQASGVDVDSAKDRMAKKRVLVLDHCTPTPDQDAGSVSLYNIMMLLRDMDFQVTFIPEDNFLYVPDYTPALQRAGIEVLYSPWVQTVEQHLQEFGGRYDLVFLFRPTVVERNLPNVKKYSPQAKTLFYTHDLHYLRMTREAQLDNDAKKIRAAEAMRMREFAAIEAVDRSILVSTAERELLEAEIPDARLAVFPLILDIPGTKTAWGQRKDIVFVGGFQHTPNVDAMLYFCQDVMPHLRSLLPGARLFIVGSKPPQEIQALQGDDIIVTGFVDDLNSLLERVRLSVAPLRFGAGIKGKIGTALAAGLPTVATSLAAEGMSLADEENILIADEAEDFAKAIARLYNDEQLWNHLSKAGISFAEKAWGAKAAWQGLAEILDTVGLAPEPTRHPLHLFSQMRAH